MNSISSHTCKKHLSESTDSMCLSCMSTICRLCIKEFHNGHSIALVSTVEHWINEFEKQESEESALLEKENALLERVTEVFDNTHKEIDALKNLYIKQIQSQFEEYHNQAFTWPHVSASSILAWKDSLKDYLYNQPAQKPIPRTLYTDLQLDIADLREWSMDKKENIALYQQRLDDNSLFLNNQLQKQIKKLLSNLASEIKISTSLNSTDRKLSDDFSASFSQTDEMKEQGYTTWREIRPTSTASQSSRSSKSHTTFVSAKNEKVKQNLEIYASALRNSLKEININVFPTFENGLNLINPRVWLEGPKIESLKQKLGGISLLYLSAITDVTLIYKEPSSLGLESLLQSLDTLTNLSTLDLSFKMTQKMTLETLKSFKKYFPEFKKLRNLRLDFAQWSHIDHACIDNLMTYIVSIPKLTALTIDFSHSFSINNHLIERIFNGLSKKTDIKMLNLNFSNCKYVYGNWVETTIKSSVLAMKDLEELIIEFKGCFNMREEAVRTLRKQLESVPFLYAEIVTKETQ